jgi:hypothetical protein
MFLFHLIIHRRSGDPLAGAGAAHQAREQTRP